MNKIPYELKMLLREMEGYIKDILLEIKEF